MPPKRTASKVNAKEDDKKIKDTVKRSTTTRTTRGAKNKRELSDDEPVDIKKKRITDKVNSKVPSKETNENNKATTEPEEENIEATSKSTATIKRKRTAVAYKETKSAKIKKDFNDNEFLNENDNQDNDEQFKDNEKSIDEEDDNDKPIIKEQKATRGRKKAAANLDKKINDNLNEKTTALVKRGRGRKKATDLANEQTEDVNKDDDNDQLDNNDILDQEEEKASVVKRGRRKQLDYKVVQVVEEEQPKKRVRGKKQQVESVAEEQQKIEADEIVTEELQQPVTRKPRSKVLKKTTTIEEQQKDDVLEPAKKRGRSKKVSESENDKLEIESQQTELQPAKIGRGRPGAKKINLLQKEHHDEKLQSEENDNEQLSQQKPATKKSRKVTRQNSKESEIVDNDLNDKKIDENDEKLTEQNDQIKEDQVNEEEINKETIKEPEQLVAKKVRGKSKQTTSEELNKETESEQEIPTAVKKGRRAKKDRKENEDEVIETQLQPIESQSQPTESVIGKRGRRPTKKIIENNELEVQPTISAATAGRRGKKKKDKIIEEQQHQELNDDNKELDDEEDDNKSEQELVIDLPDELPIKPKQNRVQKRPKETVTKELSPTKESLTSINKETGHQKEQSSNEHPQQSVKSVRGKKHEEKEAPLSKLTTNKRKQDDIAALSNEDSDQIESIEEEKIISKKEDVKRPVKRKHAAIEMPKEQPVELVNNDKQEQQMQEEIATSEKEKDVNKSITEEQTIKEKGQEISSSSSQIEYDLKQNDINVVMEEMKSIVEETIAAKEDLSFLTETTTNDLTTTKDSDDLTSLNELTGEVYSAKELEEYTVGSDEFKLTYESVDLKNNFINETTKVTNELPSTSNTLSFTTNDNADTEAHARKRIKLFSTIDKLALPDIEETVVAFGEDNAGALGQGRIITDGKSKPVKIKVDENERFCYISTFAYHSACINTNGKLYTFGNNDECALGRSTVVNPSLDEHQMSEEELSRLAIEAARKQETNEATPKICDISLDNCWKIFKVTTGDSHTAVLTTNGSVKYWGNFRDQNGNIGLSVDKLTANLEPVSIDEDLEIIDIASGGHFILLLDSCGTVYSLGAADVGQLGRLKSEDCKLNKSNRALYFEPRPVQFPSSKIKIDRIWAGEFHSFARSTDNRIFAWGLNNYAQLGFKQIGESNEEQCVYQPKEVSYFTKLGFKIEKIACGQHHSIALDNRGNVFALGRHDYGRLGLGRINEDAQQPKMIESFKGKKVIDIACSTVSSFAITEDGKIYSWGMGSLHLGHGENTDDIFEPTMVQFRAMNRFQASKISAGVTHCLVLGNLTDKEENNNNKAVNNGIV